MTTLQYIVLLDTSTKTREAKLTTQSEKPLINGSCSIRGAF